MNTKKTALIMASFIIMVAIASANSAGAAEWTPLVRIPGLPAAGTVNLSMYLIGLYNFMLSVVGIVAVVMLIIGGMRYITAVGNPTAISDAKDIINNAIVGLILALLSWVFISAINPDVLYIKQPGAGFTTSSVQNLKNCWTTYTVATGACVCKDSATTVAATEQICQDYCLAGHCNLPTPTPCIANGSPVDANSINYKTDPYNSRCRCVDQVFVALAGASCQATCAPANCLVARLTMTIKDIKHYASSYEKIDGPFVIPELSWIQFDLKADSIFFNPFLNGCLDGFGPSHLLNDVCDAEEVLPLGVLASNVSYTWFSANVLCSNIADPSSVQCPIKYWVRDTAGNENVNIFWMRILK